jgi:hypothetical protein
MEAKAKGLSEDTVMAEIGGHKEFQEQELEDARSPILRDPAPYQNPYDIGYVCFPLFDSLLIAGTNPETTCRSTLSSSLFIMPHTAI